MKCLIDTNIFLDYILEREPFFLDAKKVLFAIEFSDNLEGTVSSSIITDIYYIARKMMPKNDVKDFLLHILNFIDVIDIDNAVIKKALLSDFNDFEDAVQNYSAIEAECNCIITRNKNDYKNSVLDILTAKEFLSLISP